MRAVKARSTHGGLDSRGVVARSRATVATAVTTASTRRMRPPMTAAPGGRPVVPPRVRLRTGYMVNLWGVMRPRRLVGGRATNSGIEDWWGAAGGTWIHGGLGQMEDTSALRQGVLYPPLWSGTVVHEIKSG
jgi:hypothetical protein